MRAWARCAIVTRRSCASSNIRRRRLRDSHPETRLPPFQARGKSPRHLRRNLSRHLSRLTRTIRSHSPMKAKAVVGIEMDEIGTAVVPFYLAPLEGARLTWNATQAITTGLFSFFKNLFMGAASFSEVTGPV